MREIRCEEMMRARRRKRLRTEKETVSRENRMARKEDATVGRQLSRMQRLEVGRGKGDECEKEWLGGKEKRKERASVYM